MGRAVRAQVWQRLRARRHWVMAFPAHARGVAARVLAAVDAGVGLGDPPVPVDRWTIDLAPADSVDDTAALEPMALKPRHNRLCWVSQTRAAKRAYRRCLKAGETGSMLRVKRTPMVLKLTAGS